MYNLYNYGLSSADALLCKWILCVMVAFASMPAYPKIWECSGKILSSFSAVDCDSDTWLDSIDRQYYSR